MPTSAATAVLTDLSRVREWQQDLYRDIHQHPELSHQEHRTAGLVAERLRQHGFDVHEGIGGTGVVGILRSGDGPAVLLRADMDALPVEEATGLPYASTVRATDKDGDDVPVMHACGHDVHVVCLLGAAALLAAGTDSWSGTVVAVFQPAEEAGDGARAMVDDGLAETVPTVDVALAQHVLPVPAGVVGVHRGPFLSAADSMRITVYGRGSHGSMPQAAGDPVVLAAMIVIRLQTIVSREVAPDQTVVLTVGSVHAGSKSNVIGDHAVLQLNMRTYDDAVRSAVLAAIKRIVVAECQASGSPREPDFELYDRFPLTVNDDAVTDKVGDAFTDHFGDRLIEMPQGSASEDFSDIPMRWARPTRTGGSVGSTRTPTARQSTPAGSHRTSRSTIRQPSLRSCSPRWTRVAKPSSSQRWPGSATEPVMCGDRAR